MLFVFYVWRSLLTRIRANAITTLAVMLFVVGGSLGLSFYFNLRAMLVDTSPPENIIVLARGAASEAGSRLQLDAARKVALLDGVKREGDAPLAARELLTRIQLGTGLQYEEPVAIRGIDDLSAKIHRIKVVQGTLPERLDILLGSRVAADHPALTLGTEVHLPGGTGRIVGVFTADGGPFEDEVWTPRAALELHIKLKVISSVTLVAANAADVPTLIDRISESKEIMAQAGTMAKYQANVGGLETIARTVFILLALLSIVATSAIATTMNAAAAARMPELAALAAIGIRRSFLARLVMFESVALAVFGSVLGAVLAVFLSRRLGVVSLGANPVDIATSLRVPLIGVGLGIAAGIVGGIYPALRVRRLDIMQSLR